MPAVERQRHLLVPLALPYLAALPSWPVCVCCALCVPSSVLPFLLFSPLYGHLAPLGMRTGGKRTW